MRHSDQVSLWTEPWILWAIPMAITSWRQMVSCRNHYKNRPFLGHAIKNITEQAISFMRKNEHIKRNDEWIRCRKKTFTGYKKYAYFFIRSFRCRLFDIICFHSFIHKMCHSMERWMHRRTKTLPVKTMKKECNYIRALPLRSHIHFKIV